MGHSVAAPAQVAAVVCLLALLGAGGGSPQAQPDPEDGVATPRDVVAEEYEELERAIIAELEKRDSQAAAWFLQAGAARERDDHPEAARLYRQVYDRLPEFDHALRRGCWEELQMGNKVAAMTLCERAVQQAQSAANLAALARTMSTATELYPVYPAERTRAAALAREAVRLAPHRFFPIVSLCLVASDLKDGPLWDTCLAGLQADFPDRSETALFAMNRALREGRYGEAERFAGQARDRGLSEEDYRGWLAAINASKPFYLQEGFLLCGSVLGGWVGFLLLLFVAGVVLSHATLRAAGRAQMDPGAAPGATDVLLRGVYRAVLWLTCVCYWLSLPLLFFSMLAFGGGLIYLFFSVGHIPIRIVGAVGLVTILSLFAIIKSLLVRGRNTDPGARLDLKLHPRLRRLLDEVAERVGTRPADNVYMTPDAEVAVMERGSNILGTLGKVQERCLILGVGVLDGLRLGPFRAVLAHEYGHFSNRDTAGGGFALAVRRSLMAMGQTLATGGGAQWYNPAWHFVNSFHLLFLRISQGASRLQEVLADRWAALTYGSEAFEAGLRFVVERSVRFGEHASFSLQEVFRRNRVLTNLYTYRPEIGPIEKGLKENVRQALEAPASPYDSHPSVADRIAWVRTLAAPGTGRSSDDTAEAWSLFADREAIERAMTEIVRARILETHDFDIFTGRPLAQSASPMPPRTRTP